MTTTFIRLLSAQDKAEALTSAVAALRDGRTEEGVVFTVDPSSFSKVPNSPFAYWVDDSIRDLFVKLPPFEGEGRTVKQGLATADDFRFVRAWWEVPASRRLDAMNGPDHHDDLPAFQDWCRNRTREGKYWVPFAKGGEYSPYYADIHLVVNWKHEGEEIKNFVDHATGKPFSRVQNTEYYFRQGLTWLRRTHRLCVSILPSGALFSDAAQAVFSSSTPLAAILSLLNGNTVDYLVKMSVGRTGDSVQFMPGMIATVPFPLFTDYQKHEQSLCAIGIKIVSLVRSQGSLVETSPLHVASRRNIGEKSAEHDIGQTFKRLCDECNDHANSAYNNVRIDRIVEKQQEVPIEEMPGSDISIGTVLSIAFGRWDVRPLLNEKLTARLPDPFSPLPVCPPAALMGPDGLPATSGNIVSEEWLTARPDAAALPPAGIVKNPTITDGAYPIEIPWDGILVDDPDHPADIVLRMRKAMEVTWKEKADSVEQEACQALGGGDLRGYMRSPTGFFQDHLSRYSKSRRKAPIYWPLSTASGSYTLWIYYPRLTESTLYQCVNAFLKPKLDGVRAEGAALRPRMEGKPSAETRDRFDVVTLLARELEEMTQELLRVAALGYRPDLDDGVVICACPLRALFRLPRWKDELDEAWEKLEKGDFDWAHLAMALWPDRVKTACASNRSFAIAHDQEALFVPPPAAEPKPARARKGKKS